MDSPANQKQGHLYKGTLYHPTPSAPLLEININQQSAPNSYSSAPSMNIRRPPEFPPPPPPNYTDTVDSPQQHYANPNYRLPGHGLRQLGRKASIHASSYLDKVYERKNWAIFWTSLAGFCLSASLLSAGILCALKASDFCPFYSPLWTSAFFVINAITGMVAAKRDLPNLFVAHFVLSLVSIVLAIAGQLLAGTNWLLIGTYDPSKPKHPIVGRERLYCLLGEYDPNRVKHILHLRDAKYFPECLFQLKVGIAVITIQLLFNAILVILFVLSAILSARKCCTKKN